MFGYLAVRVVRRRVLTNTRMAKAFLVSCIVTQLPSVVLGEGFFGLALHLACTRLCSDLLFAILGYLLLRSIATRFFSNFDISTR